MRIRALLEDRRKQGKKAFIGYITAGDPNLEATGLFVKALARSGVDIIELGIPYSDPIADGPTNLKAAERALKNTISLESCLSFVGQMRTQEVTTPIVIFTYFNLVLKMGCEAFAVAAKKHGVDAVLFVDLPPEESMEVRKSLNSNGIGTIFLLSPTTDPSRIDLIEQCSTEFLYYVSRTGVTGVQSALSQTLGAEVNALRGRVSLPLAIGFGISTVAQAREVAQIGDAVIVGSAFVKIIEENIDLSQAEMKLAQFAAELSKAVKGE